MWREQQTPVTKLADVESRDQPQLVSGLSPSRASIMLFANSDPNTTTGSAPFVDPTNLLSAQANGPCAGRLVFDPELNPIKATIRVRDAGTNTPGLNCLPMNIWEPALEQTPQPIVAFPFGHFFLGSFSFSVGGSSTRGGPTRSDKSAGTQPGGFVILKVPSGAGSFIMLWTWTRRHAS